MLKSVWGHFYCLFGLFYLSEPTKDNIVKAVVFPVIMYGCEIKKAEHQEIDAFE